MSGAAAIEAVYGRTADGHLAARLGDNAYLAVPVSERLRIKNAWRLGQPIAEWTQAQFYGGMGTVPDEAAFRAHVEELVQHRREVHALGRTHEPGNGVWTPWEWSQGAEVYAEGVVFHSTAGHGGFNLDDTRNATMPAILRIESGWYEEDCDWALVAFGFPELFTAYERRIAEKTLRDTFPERWEAIHGRALAPGESFMNDRRLFEVAHAQDWIVVSAIRSDVRPGFVECIATLGGDRAGSRRCYLVPAGEYRCEPHGFVIDEARHDIWDGPTAFAA